MEQGLGGVGLDGGGQVHGLHAAEVVLGAVGHAVLVHLEEPGLALCTPQSDIHQSISAFESDTVTVHHSPAITVSVQHTVSVRVSINH